MKKSLVILVLLVSCVAMLTLGCTGVSNNSPSPTTTMQVPSDTPEVTDTVTATPSPTDEINDSSTDTITVTPDATMDDDTNMSTFDDSLANVTGEDDESTPDDSIPTPDAG